MGSLMSQIESTEANTLTYTTIKTAPVIDLSAIGVTVIINGEDLLKMAARGTSALTKTTAAIVSASGQISIKGSRPNSSGVYIDGMRIGTSPSLGTIGGSLGFE